MSIKVGVIFAAVICSLGGYIIGYSAGRKESFELLKAVIIKVNNAFKKPPTEDGK